MHRRALLASIGLSTLAGCLGTDGDAADPPAGTRRTRTRTTATPTDTPPGTDSPNGTADGAAEYPALGDPVSEAGGPDFDTDVRRVVWWGDHEPESPLLLEPDTRSGSLPEATYRFSLVNDTDLRFAYNPYNWGLWKRVDGSWYSVAPRIIPQPLSFLPPGTDHTWTLTVDASHPLPSTRRGGSGGDGSVTVGGLGGGTYAFETDGWFEGQDYRESTAFGVRFSLAGDPLAVPLAESVTETARDGGTVTVRTDRESTDPTRQCAFVLERVDAPDADRMIAEQIVRDPRLRKTLPAFEGGVDRVRLVEPNGTVPPFGVNEPWRFRYDGSSYRVTAHEIGTESETESG